MRIPRRALAGVLLAGAALALGACGPPEPSVRLTDTTLIVQNQTDQTWHDVTVTMNDYYQARAESLDPHGELDAPFSGFMTGFGQRYDRRREPVRRVVIKATDASGRPVSITWTPTKNLAEKLRSTGR
ncbi:MAG TPA: hypothetical protein VFX12_13755 [Vicinamibacterales bacterium]|nr:hypothetical protein [Vicinamibacterales bacterium]